ncbi:unnamed protein product [Soboliphyme baturini]|uniref:PX domain-containing protein n=1 Tax=Soboliphyme baturini TaxID=241478 RepID=A0A183ITZ4_9BILA|nr:unnamed protein product [Soboliphyme baturini]
MAELPEWNRFKKLKRSFLPPKKLIGNHDEAFLSIRQTELQDYLRTVFKLDAILQKKKNLNSMPLALATFLDFNLYEVHGIVHDLALTISNEVEHFTDEGVEPFVLSTLQLYALTERMRLPEPTHEPSSDLMLDIGNVIEFLSCLKRLKVSKIAIMAIAAVCLKTRSIGNLQVTGGKCAGKSNIPLNSLNFSLRVLDLTCNCLRDIDNLQHLPYLTELNLSNNRIEKIEHWNKKLGNVKKLRLTNNKIHSLKGLSKLYSLEYLDVRDNNLSHIKQVWPVGNLPCLQVLLLSGNCVENSIDYRTRILEAFGERASEVRVNNDAATQRELDTVTIRLAIRKAKEDRRLQLLNATKQISQAVSLAEAEVLKSFDMITGIPNPSQAMNSARLQGKTSNLAHSRFADLKHEINVILDLVQQWS